MDSNHDFRGFYLTLEQLADVSDCLFHRINQGLEAYGLEIKALPAYLGVPSGTLNDEAVALDLGGTNIRAARIKVKGAAAELLAGPVSDQSHMMRRSERAGEVNAGEFFARQADLIAEVSARSRIKVGYCFSFPAEIGPGCSAKLIAWTKGINIANVVGTSVGERLLTALRERGRDVAGIPVLNDTVASLLAGALIAPECTHHIGLIAGTGTNMAGFFPLRQITKLDPASRIHWGDDDYMAVNLESGNFAPPHLTDYDDLLASSDPTDNPGSQRFEKAVSGFYLPRLFRLLIGADMCSQLGINFDSHDVHSGTISDLRKHNGVVGQAASALLDRSADLLAAAAAGLIKSYGHGPKSVGILVEGGLFWRTPGYCDRFQQTLSTLIDKNTTARLLKCRAGIDANLLGAACAALSAPGCTTK